MHTVMIWWSAAFGLAGAKQAGSNSSVRHVWLVRLVRPFPFYAKLHSDSP